MKKLFLYPILLPGFLFLSFSLTAQEAAPVDDGLAGPDVHTCKMNNQTRPVKIGPASGGVKTSCYYWTPEAGLNDPHIPNPTASPSSTTTYTLKIVFEDFTAELTDQVTVYVDVINGFTITNKTCCFKPGASITTKDFNITTDPPGLEDQVYFEPATAPWVPQQVHQYPVIAKIKCDKEYTILHSINISVVNEDNMTTVQASLGPVQKGVEALTKVVEYLVNGTKNIPGNPCPPSFGPQINLFRQDGKLCCPNATCIDDKYKIGGNIKVCGGTTCDIPLLGVPGVASFNAVLLFNACLGAQIDYTKKCDGGDVCFTGLSELSFGGGISGTLLGGAAARVAGTFVNQISAPPIQICVPSGKFQLLGQVCYQLDAVLSVQFLSGYFGWQWKTPIIPKVCM